MNSLFNIVDQSLFKFHFPLTVQWYIYGPYSIRGSKKKIFRSQTKNQWCCNGDMQDTTINLIANSIDAWNEAACGDRQSNMDRSLQISKNANCVNYLTRAVATVQLLCVARPVICGGNRGHQAYTAEWARTSDWIVRISEKRQRISCLISMGRSIIVAIYSILETLDRSLCAYESQLAIVMSLQRDP